MAIEAPVIPTGTKLWCPFCQRVQAMRELANRLWNPWVCLVRKHERPLAIGKEQP
jgi:hypothetical protein